MYTFEQFNEFFYKINISEYFHCFLLLKMDICNKSKCNIFSFKAIMEDMDHRLAALNSVKTTASDLFEQAGDSEDEAIQGMI